MICLSLFSGAYVTEIVRAGIQSIPRAQIEAGASIGLSRWKIMRLVVLPQALQRVIPPLAGQFIILIKDSSLVSLISIQELTFYALDIAVSTTRVFEVWIFVGALYFVICYACALAFDWLERRGPAPPLSGEAGDSRPFPGRRRRSVRWLSRDGYGSRRKRGEPFPGSPLCTAFVPGMAREPYSATMSAQLRVVNQ